MGKRSNFARVERDFYPTPKEAVLPLLPHLKPGTRFVEPCCGAMDLVKALEAHGHHCVAAMDIEIRPSAVTPCFPIYRGDATIDPPTGNNFDCYITNPPWRRDVLHPLIERLSSIKPTWLLFDADWMHTKQSEPYMMRCRKIVSVGRVKWIPNSAMTGKDNCSWYLFDQAGAGRAEFFGRVSGPRHISEIVPGVVGRIKRGAHQ